MVVKMLIAVFWIVALCGLVGGYRLNKCLPFTTLNVGNFQQDYKMS
jgi:hypothetical protein